MLAIFSIFVILGLGTIIKNLIEIQRQNDTIIEILDAIHRNQSEDDF